VAIRVLVSKNYIFAGSRQNDAAFIKRSKTGRVVGYSKRRRVSEPGPLHV